MVVGGGGGGDEDYDDVLLIICGFLTPFAVLSSNTTSSLLVAAVARCLWSPSHFKEAITLPPTPLTHPAYIHLSYTGNALQLVHVPRPRAPHDGQA
mgnify:CR=1 FL=1